MDLVIDANILFAVLIKKGKTEELLFAEAFNLFAPEFIFEEFKKYKDLILKKTGRSPKEFEKLISIVKKRIKLIPNEEITKFLKKAERISPDDNDVDYFALALKLKCPIWSNDKRLKKQKKVIIYSTSELIKIFGY